MPKFAYNLILRTRTGINITIPFGDNFYTFKSNDELSAYIIKWGTFKAGDVIDGYNEVIQAYVDFNNGIVKDKEINKLKVFLEYTEY